jgi:type IV secretion system protein VirD4
VRVAFAPNDERTAKRLSDALGTMTELRAQRNLAGHRLSPWLSRLAVAEQETPRPLMTPGEVLQLPPDQSLVLVSGTPPIRARKLRYFEDGNLARRCLPPPSLNPIDRPAARPDDWSGLRCPIAERLQLPWSDLVASGGRRRDPAEDRDLLPAHGDRDEPDWPIGENGSPGAHRDHSRNSHDDISGI